MIISNCDVQITNKQPDLSRVIDNNVSRNDVFNIDDKESTSVLIACVCENPNVHDGHHEIYII